MGAGWGRGGGGRGPNAGLGQRSPPVGGIHDRFSIFEAWTWDAQPLACATMKKHALAASVVLSLFALPAAAQPAASAHGVDLAGMDRQVAPATTSSRYANGGWMKSAEIPPDRSQWGAGGELIELTTAAVSGPDPGAPPGRAGRTRRRARSATTTSSYLDEDRDRAAGPRTAEADARPHRGDQGQAGAGRRVRPRAARRRRRAQLHQLPHRPPVRPVGRAGPATIPAATRPTCCRAASACPTATTTSRPEPAHGRRPRRPIRRTSPRC